MARIVEFPAPSVIAASVSIVFVLATLEPRTESVPPFMLMTPPRRELLLALVLSRESVPP